jgi:hypothetical protein
MADLVTTIQSAIGSAFAGPLKPFLKPVTIRFLLADGVYDPTNDSVVPSYDTQGPFALPCIKPTNDDAKNYGADSTEQKIILPANLISREPQDSDHVEIAGVNWRIRKVVGTPGTVIYTLFVRRT